MTCNQSIFLDGVDFHFNEITMQNGISCFMSRTASTLTGSLPTHLASLLLLDDIAAAVGDDDDGMTSG